MDDEKAVVALLRGWIEPHGMAIDVASDGLEALEKARQNRPDIILLDAIMPVLGGLAALEELKRDPDLCDIPVLILSGVGETQDKVYALDLGATDYLTKPFKPQELMARIRTALRSKLQQDEWRLGMRRASTRLDCLPAPYLGLDADGLVVTWNREAAKATGLEPRRVLGEPATAVLAFPGEAPWARGLDHDGPAQVRTPSGLMPVRVLGRALPEEDGGGYGLLLLPSE